MPSLLGRLLGRSASEYGTLCHVDRDHGSGDHLRMPLMLPILPLIRDHLLANLSATRICTLGPRLSWVPSIRSRQGTALSAFAPLHRR